MSCIEARGRVAQPGNESHGQCSFLWLRELPGKDAAQWSEVTTPSIRERVAPLEGRSGQLTLATLVSERQREIVPGACLRLSPPQMEGPRPCRGSGLPAGTTTALEV